MGRRTGICTWSLAMLFICISATRLHAETNVPEVRKIEMQCGQYKVAIKCGKGFNAADPEDARMCNRNTLSFTSADGKEYIPPTPQGFDETKTPVGLSCVQAKDGRYYIEVEYSNGPSGCVWCMTYHLFESSGIRLSADNTDRMVQYEKARKKRGIAQYAKWINIEGEEK